MNFLIPDTITDGEKSNIKFETGDYAKIIANESAHEFEIGTIVKLEKHEDDYKAFANGDYWWVTDDDLTEIGNEEMVGETMANNKIEELLEYLKNDKDIGEDSLIYKYFCQKAELDDLKRDDLPRCKDALRRANENGMALEKENQELKAEIERLQNKVEELSEVLSDTIRIRYAEAKAEAVKEFAERLKERAIAHYFDNCCFAVPIEDIDNLLKEMVGEQRKEDEKR